MAQVLRFIHNFDHKVVASINRFARVYPRLTFLCLFIGMPLFTIAAVTFCSLVIMFPIAWLCGWL